MDSTTHLPAANLLAVSKRTYAIIGTGALGGYYGGLLARAGFDVHFLLHSDYEHVRDHGLVIECKGGDFTLPRVNAYRTPAEMPCCDVVVVALKTTLNRLLPELLPPVMGERSTALVLQNGLGVEDQVAAVVGDDRVVGGLCFLCSNKVGPGHIQHLDYGRITLADYKSDGTAAGVTDRITRIAVDLEAAGIPVRMSRDLVKARWKKLVWNIPFNGLSVVLDATTDRIMADPDAYSMAHALMVETVAAADAVGHPVGDEVIQTMLDQTAKMPPYLTSMKLDYNHSRPMEVDAIFGAPLRAAGQAGLATPRIEALYQQLSSLDRRNRGTT